MGKDYYAVLGVAQNATAQQIKERFLQLVREYHPDRLGDDAKNQAEDEFQSMSAAYNVLSDPEARLVYDRELKDALAGKTQSQEGDVGRVYRQRGLKAYRDGDQRAAVQNFERAVEASPNEARGWYGLAKAYIMQNERWTRAAQAIVRACELESMNSDYHALAGEILLEAGEPLESMAHLQEAIDWGADEQTLSDSLKRARKLASKMGRGSG